MPSRKPGDPDPDLNQGALKGMVPKKIKEIADAMEKFLKLRTAATAAGTVRDNAEDELLRVMQKNKRKEYGMKYGKTTYVAALTQDEVVHVKRQTKDRK